MYFIHMPIELNLIELNSKWLRVTDLFLRRLLRREEDRRFYLRKVFVTKSVGN